jgi:hypothetical protein
MHEFTVKTGKLTITILAESARDAALEAVQVWKACASLAKQAHGNQALHDAAHRANLDSLTTVKRGRGFERRFATFNLLAEAHGESANAAWERVLRQCVGGLN